MIRWPGPRQPWIVWKELVFIEWAWNSYSVYVQTGNALGRAESGSGLMSPTPGQLDWREVLGFVRAEQLEVWTTARQIAVCGVERWQKEVVTAAILGLPIAKYLDAFSDKRMEELDKQFGGFTSRALNHLVSLSGPASLRKSTTKVPSGVSGSCRT